MGDMVYLVLLAGTVFLKEMPCGSSRLEGCLVAQVDVTSARSADSRMMGAIPKGYPKLGETPEISARTASNREELRLDVTCRLSMASEAIWPLVSTPFSAKLPRRTHASRFVDSRDAPGIRPFLENGA